MSILMSCARGAHVQRRAALKQETVIRARVRAQVIGSWWSLFGLIYFIFVVPVFGAIECQWPFRPAKCVCSPSEMTWVCSKDYDFDDWPDEIVLSCGNGQARYKICYFWEHLH